MKRLIVLSMVLIVLLFGCSSEKTFINTNEVIKALDKHNLDNCEVGDSEMFLSNETVSCEIELGGSELIGSALFNISTYDDIKKVDLFKDKCEKNDVDVVPDCRDMLGYNFYHSNVMMTYVEMFVPEQTPTPSTDPNRPISLTIDMRPASEDTIDSILEDLAD